MRNEELWYRLSAIIFFVEATAGRLFLVCPYIPAISTHYLCFHKPCRGRYFAVPQNRFALCGFYVVLWDRKSGAEFFYSDTALILLLVCFSSIAFLHRFCRLAPIEALPQTPTGLCPVPTMGFTP